MKKIPLSNKLLFITYLTILIILLFIGISVGAATYDLTYLWKNGLRSFFYEDNTMHAIFCLRLIRVFSVLLIGSLLALVGSVLQTLLRNPLADPFILGISAGGTVAAATATILGIPFLFYGIPVRVIMSLGGCLLTTGFILFIKKHINYLHDEFAIPIIGLVLNSFFGAILMLIIVFAQKNQTNDIYKWLIGTVQNIDFSELFVVFLIGIISSLFLLRFAAAIRALSFGDDFAKSIGFNANKIRLITFIVVAIIISISVSISGTVGFVGLIIPHIAKKIHKNSLQQEWVASALLGGIIMLVADICSRVLARPTELPIGMFTAIIGAPILAFLLIKKVNTRVVND